MLAYDMRFLTRLSALIFVFSLKSPLALAAQDAIIRSRQAIIYSDLEKTSPIGYVKRGRKVKVGEIPRAKGTVLPIVVSGRICYIKITDLYLRKEVEKYTKTVKYKDIDLMKKFKDGE